MFNKKILIFLLLLVGILTISAVSANEIVNESDTQLSIDENIIEADCQNDESAGDNTVLKENGEEYDEDNYPGFEYSNYYDDAYVNLTLPKNAQGNMVVSLIEYDDDYEEIYTEIGNVELVNGKASFKLPCLEFISYEYMAEYTGDDYEVEPVYKDISIVPKVILDCPKYGCVNIHASILPKYRGAAPIQWALINGEEKTGITLMYMDEDMDTGDIIDTVEYKIKDEDDIGTLHDNLSILGSELLDKNLDNLISGNIKRIKQNDNEATYAPMIEREMEEIDFNDTVLNINNKIRAFSPWPLSRTKIKNEEIKIVKAHTTNEESIIGKLYITKNTLGIGANNGIVYLDIIKPVGKNIMNIKDYLNGKLEQLNEEK